MSQLILQGNIINYRSAIRLQINENGVSTHYQSNIIFSKLVCLYNKNLPITSALHLKAHQLVLWMGIVLIVLFYLQVCDKLTKYLTTTKNKCTIRMVHFRNYNWVKMLPKTLEKKKKNPHEDVTIQLYDNFYIRGLFV